MNAMVAHWLKSSATTDLRDCYSVHQFHIHDESFKGTSIEFVKKYIFNGSQEKGPYLPRQHFQNGSVQWFG